MVAVWHYEASRIKMQPIGCTMGESMALAG
jgi:hypothetical protein